MPRKNYFRVLGLIKELESQIQLRILNRIGRVVIKTLLWITGSIVALILLVFILIRIPAVQNYVLKQVTAYLEAKIETPFRIGRINLELPKLLVLEDVYIEDRNRDTLLAGEKLRVDINLLRLFNQVVEINRVDLVGITANVNRKLPDRTFNFAYIIDAFVDPDRDPPPDTVPPLVIDIDRINLERIRIGYHDEVIGLSTRLAIGELRTRIGTFDLTGAMHFAVPELTVNGLSGDLEQWAVEDLSTDSVDTSENDAGGLLPALELGTIRLSGIDFAYRNRQIALDTRFEIHRLDTRFDALDLNEAHVAVDHLHLDGSRSHVIFGAIDDLTPASEPAVTKAEPTPTQTMETNESGWRVSAHEIRLSATDFLYRDDHVKRIPAGFDYGHIRITELNGEITDLYYSTDSISGDLKHLAAKDGSGFEIRRLQSKFTYTDQGATLDGLYAETPHTRIQNYLRVRYPSLELAAQQPGDIAITADLQKSHLGMRDVLYFVPDLDTIAVMEPLMDQTFYVDGQIRGQVDDLQIPSFRMRTLEQTVVDVRAHLKGLPDIARLQAQLELQTLTTGRADLEQLLARGLLPDSIRLPTQISLQGTFNGGMDRFDTDLTLSTSEGNAHLEGRFQTAANTTGGTDTTYRAQLAVMDIDLGRILRMDSTLGRFSFSAAVNGRGLDPQTAVASIDAELIGLEALGYTYRDIRIEANADRGAITATAESPDPNIDFDLRATADLGGTYPKLNLRLMVDSVNLRNLQLMEDEFRYHGLLVADLQTADIDHLNGTVEILNSSLAYHDERYTLDSVTLLASADEESNTMQLTSEFLTAHLVGKYQLSQLQAAIQDIVAVYYQPDSVPAVYTYAPQQFDFSATFKRSRVIRDFLPELTEMDDVLLDGSFNSNDKFLLAKATAPRILYAGTEIKNLTFDVNTFDSTLYYTALVERIAVSNIELTNTLLSGTVLQNQLDFGLWIKDQQDKERYHLGMELVADAGDFLFSLKEDGLMLNYDQWEVDPQNNIAFGRNGIRSSRFVLTQNDQQLSIQSQDSTHNAPIELVFDNFRIETFSQMLESELLNMGGGINGRATVSRLESTPLFISDITIDKFFFGRDTVGDVLINVHNEQENTFAAQVEIVGNGNQVRLAGDFIAPPDQTPRLNFVLDLDPLDMQTLEAFSLGYIRNTDGNVTGKLSITGTSTAPLIDGALQFNDAQFNIAMLNATIHADQQQIRFDRQGIRFNRFELKDRQNNIARLDGTLATKTYTAFDFNLTLTTDDFQLLNSTQQDNDLFYGQLFVSSNLKITGNLNNPVVNGNLRVGENTDAVFVLPNDDPGLVEREGIIKFVDRSDTSRVNVFARLDSLRTTEISGLRLSMNIQTDEEAAFTIVLDPGSEDALHIRGSADLTAGIDPSGDITLTGTYTVQDGRYSFTFEPVKRIFNFRQGSTIRWTGDPMEAQLDITAVYKLRAPTLELVQSQVGNDAAMYKQRVPFDVNLGITGPMLQPALHFWIDLDEDNALISQDVVTKVTTALNQLEENESEMNKQVFALIVLGRFMASNPFESLSGGGVESMARNSVSSLLSAQLNRLASDLIKGVELDFDLQSGSDYSTGTMQSRTDLNIGVSKMLFDDRLKVTIGSNFELEGQARPGEQTTNIAGDISVDYQLSKDGRYLLRVYRKNQYQVTLQGQYVETGVGFIINMDYDKFREIFTGAKETADMFSPDTREFRQRFDRARMEADSVYRDSVRQVLRDSLERADPEFRKRMEERRQRQRERNRGDRERQRSVSLSAEAERRTAARMRRGPANAVRPPEWDFTMPLQAERRFES